MVSPVEVMVLTEQACRLDREENNSRGEYKNVVTGCIEGAKLAELIAGRLISDATHAVTDPGDLAAAKENIDGLIEQVDKLKIFVIAARWRREIPDVVWEKSFFEPLELQKLLKDLSHY